MLNKLKKIDWFILLILCALMFIAYFVIQSATFNTVKYVGRENRQLLFFFIGLAIVIVMAFVDYRLFLRSSWISYGVVVILLILIFPFGANINGANGWFVIFGQSFQPAELGKIIVIIGLAHLLGKRNGEPLRFRRDIIPIGLYVFVPFGLILYQPDLGNAIIYCVIFVGMIWIANVKYRHVLLGLIFIAAVLGMFLLLFTTFNGQVETFLDEKGKGHWHDRINTFLHPEEATADAKMQSENSLVAIGSGGLLGAGFKEGTMKNNGFIPYAYSDSIFVVVGEEFGFAGSALLLLLYFMLIYRFIMIAFNCQDRRATYIIVGIVSMFVFQIFQNIGMMIGIMPITGITLPFISYGGTSLVINMFCIGIVLSIKAHQYKYELPD